MKKLALVALLAPAIAFGQIYPSPTFQNLTVLGTSTVPYSLTVNNPSATTVAGKLNQIVNLTDFNPACNGTTNDDAAVSNAVTAIGSTPTTLIVSCPVKIAANHTFAQGTQLDFEANGRIIGTTGAENVQVQQQILAGRTQIFSNVAAQADVGMTVEPEWFGAQLNNSGIDSGPAFNTAFSFLRNTGGTIEMAAGTYTTATTITNNWSHIRLVGQGLNITTIAMTSATLDGIDNFGASGTPLANDTFEDFSIICSAAGSSTGSFGINLQYNAFTHLRNMQVQEFLYGVNLLRATNTEIDFVGASYVNGSTNGFTGFNFNGGGTGTAGNASTNLRDTFVSGNNTLTGSVGYKFGGAYMSDLYFDNASTAGTNYGYYFDYSTASYVEDVIINQPIVDQFTAQGIFVNNMPSGGQLTISGGWINPKAGSNNNTSDVYISGSSGVITLIGSQIVSDNDTVNDTGLNIINSKYVNAIGNQFKNNNVSVLMSGSGYNTISGNIFKNDAITALAYVKATGDTGSTVANNVFSGYATTAISFDATSSGSSAINNTINTANITTPVQNSGSNPIGGGWTGTGLGVLANSPTINGANFTGATGLAYSGATFFLNDTSGSGQSAINFDASGTVRWQLFGQSTTGANFGVSRFVSGTFTDIPFSISNSTGAVTMVDGITSTPISGSSGSFTTLSASSTVSGIPGRLLNIQVFSSSGTYTPTTGTAKVIVEVQAPGGGGGGVAATSASQNAIAQAGSGGSYASSLITSGFSGATVTIGSVGTGGAAGANAGTSGGTTSFGSIISCPGGVGGVGAAGQATGFTQSGAAAPSGCTVSGATTLYSVSGTSAAPVSNLSSTAAYFVPGGASHMGSNSNSGNGVGGNGAAIPASTSATAGSNGTGGKVIVYEYD
ncbi:hypothetical protein [Paraburkholderia sp. BL21I4N1]|uniref:beta strand repeat-containing protein n=1 Tax=Paraburkholderia sp. BL21I4N1 TaxID=1938801 RepID=UPI000CFC5664|nr:hypothetical protein [Paraburkholderia sp. BL21I4N1]PQV51805.1 hypothetical protein B0G83_10412 [Paraburkholderia sp. BL21I4N1]